MREMDFAQIRTLEEYEANKAAVDARLLRRSSPAEYEANRETIQRLCALQDCHFIFETLKMRKWYSRDGGGAWAYCSQAFWEQWRRDRVQMSRRVLQVDKRRGRYVLYAYSDVLVALLLSA